MNDEFGLLLIRYLRSAIFNIVVIIVTIEVVQEVLGGRAVHVKVRCFDCFDFDSHGSVRCCPLEHFFIREERLLLLLVVLGDRLFLNFLGITSISVSFDNDYSDNE